MEQAYLPQFVRALKNDKSNVVFTILHNEHAADEQNFVCPPSPRLHSRFVPCHRRFSFPADRPELLNWP